MAMMCCGYRNSADSVALTFVYYVVHSYVLWLVGVRKTQYTVSVYSVQSDRDQCIIFLF